MWPTLEECQQLQTVHLGARFAPSGLPLFQDGEDNSNSDQFAFFGMILRRLPPTILHLDLVIRYDCLPAHPGDQQLQEHLHHINWSRIGEAVAHQVHLSSVRLAVQLPDRCPAWEAVLMTEWNNESEGIEMAIVEGRGPNVPHLQRTSPAYVHLTIHMLTLFCLPNTVDLACYCI